MVECPLRMRKVPGSNPGSSKLFSFFYLRRNRQVNPGSSNIFFIYIKAAGQRRTLLLFRSLVESAHFNALTQSEGVFDPCLYSQAVELETAKFTLEDGDCAEENNVFCLKSVKLEKYFKIDKII